MGNRFIPKVRRCSLCRRNLQKHESRSACGSCKKLYQAITAAHRAGIRLEGEEDLRYVEKLALRGRCVPRGAEQ